MTSASSMQAHDPHCPTAGWAGFDVDAEDALEALRPGHRATTFCRCRVVRIRRRSVLTSPAPPGRRYPRAVFAVTAALSACGSKITCVVPSRYGVFSW